MQKQKQKTYLNGRISFGSRKPKEHEIQDIYKPLFHGKFIITRSPYYTVRVST